MRDRERERERQRHRQREKQVPCKGARHGTQSQVSRIRPWAEGGSKPLSHLGCPVLTDLFQRERVHVRSQRGRGEREKQRHRQREKQAPCWEPELGLDPGTLGSRPGSKAGAKPLSHPGIPNEGDFNLILSFHQLKDHRLWLGVLMLV